MRFRPTGGIRRGPWRPPWAPLGGGVRNRRPAPVATPAHGGGSSADGRDTRPPSGGADPPITSAATARAYTVISSPLLGVPRPDGGHEAGVLEPREVVSHVLQRRVAPVGEVGRGRGSGPGSATVDCAVLDRSASTFGPASAIDTGLRLGEPARAQTLQHRRRDVPQSAPIAVCRSRSVSVRSVDAGDGVPPSGAARCASSVGRRRPVAASVPSPGRGHDGMPSTASGAVPPPVPEAKERRTGRFSYGAWTTTRRPSST